MEILIREPCACRPGVICTLCWGTGYTEQWILISEALKANKRKPKNENRSRKKANPS